MSRLILFPGLGADERMFEKLNNVDPVPLIPRHLVPAKGECLDNYASRVADWLAINDEDVIGGSSFGGLVAAAVARQRPVKGLALIGSALDAAALGEAGRLASFAPDWLLRRLLHSHRMLEKVFSPESMEMRRLAWAMLRETPEELLLRGSRMMWRYCPKTKIGCPVFAIHGKLDPIMSPPPLPACRMVEGAGHGIAWTHGELVGEFLDEVMAVCGAPSGSQSPPNGPRL